MKSAQNGGKDDSVSQGSRPGRGGRDRGGGPAGSRPSRSPARTRRQEEDRRRRLRWLTLATAAVVAVAVLLAVAVARQEGAPEDVFALDRQPALGAADAPVTVVEFADFKCPYCRDFTLNEFPRFKEEYIDTGKVRFYFINYPFIGSDSDTAAEALEAVHAQRPEAVWDFIEAVMEHQGPEHQRWATPEFLVDLARQAVPGLDAQRLADDLETRRYRDEVEADRAIARQVGVQGTPSLFVNGEFVRDWSYEGLKAAVDAALARSGAGTGGTPSGGQGEP